MKINIKKDHLSTIEKAFEELKENKASKDALTTIENALKDVASGHTFTVKVVNTNKKGPTFVMAILPDVSVVDKIVMTTLNNDDIEKIRTLWHSNTHWTIELDASSFDKLTAKELTASLLHELGHIVGSDTVPAKIATVFRYEMAKAPMHIKAAGRLNVFRAILSLPILNICFIGDATDKKALKEEVKADKFAKKYGYANELASALSKVSNGNDAMAKSAKVSVMAVDAIRTRQRKLSKQILESVQRNFAGSDTMDAYMDTIMEWCFGGNPDSMTVYDEDAREKVLLEHAEITEDEYITEFFSFGKKRLSRFDPMTIDYIQVKITEIHNENDKIMLLTYLYDKLNIVEFYLGIVSDPSNTKYIVPNTKQELLEYKKRLVGLREAILKYHIPMRHRDMLVAWPTGYEG